MAFPSIAASATSAFSAGTSSVNATNPSGITAGQLLLAWMALQGTTTRTTPTGWTQLGTAVGGNAHRVYLYARVATGDAGDTLTLDRSGGSAYVSFGISRIVDWFGSIADGVDAGSRTITNNGAAASTAVTGDPGGFSGINFGGVSPAWGSADTLWIGGVALESSNLTDPANYTQAYYADNSGTSHNIESWWRQNATATEDPPLFGSAGANIAAFFIAVRPAAPAGPTINTQPSNATVTAPAAANFTVAATASAGSLTYQWQRNPGGVGSWANVTGGSGGTSATYTTPATTVSGGSANNGDQYRCVVTDSNASVNSNAATLTVEAAPLSVTLDALIDESGNPRASYTVDKVCAIRVSDNTLVATWVNQTTNGSGVLPALTNAALTAAPHVFVTWDDNETPQNAGAKVYTPA